MIVKVIKSFGDKTTGATYDEQLKRKVGEVFECDDESAKERIAGKFVKKATKEEAKTYIESLETNDELSTSKKEDEKVEKIEKEQGNTSDEDVSDEELEKDKETDSEQ